jgi:hypothetical protein
VGRPADYTGAAPEAATSMFAAPTINMGLRLARPNTLRTARRPA